MVDDTAEVIQDFHAAVNMTAGELTHWLDTDESKSVGQKQDGESESTGHQSGRHIIDLLHRTKDEYSTGDIAQMKRVVSYVHRHTAQKPSGSTKDTHWRYSLMNWPMTRRSRRNKFTELQN